MIECHVCRGRSNLISVGDRPLHINPLKSLNKIRSSVWSEEKVGGGTVTPVGFTDRGSLGLLHLSYISGY